MIGVGVDYELNRVAFEEAANDLGLDMDTFSPEDYLVSIIKEALASDEGLEEVRIQVIES